MSISNDGTYSIPISGPSARMAYLRVLLLKMRGIANNIWATTRVSLSVVARIPATTATVVTSALATDHGYQATTRVVRPVATAAWRAVGWLARKAGKLTLGAARGLTTAVGHISPAGADILHAVTTAVESSVTIRWQAIDSTAQGIGETIWMLAHTSLVRTVVSLSAGTASFLFAVHTLTEGLAVSRLLGVLPRLTPLVGWVTNPWLSLAAVVMAAVVAMGVSAVRLFGAAIQRPHSSVADTSTPANNAEQESTATEEAEEQARTTTAGDALVSDHGRATVTEATIDWEEVARSVSIEVTNDGSVVVHGIPSTVPEDQRETVAHVAAQAALQQWRRVKPARPTPSRDDRRLFTKVARDALKAHARTESGGSARQAAA